MNDLDKKNINYGALNRFYQDLKSHDISTLLNDVSTLQARIAAIESQLS